MCVSCKSAACIHASDASALPVPVCCLLPFLHVKTAVPPDVVADTQVQQASSGQKAVPEFGHGVAGASDCLPLPFLLLGGMGFEEWASATTQQPVVSELT